MASKRRRSSTSIASTKPGTENSSRKPQRKTSPTTQEPPRRSGRHRTADSKPVKEEAMEATNSAAAPPLPSLEQDTPARRRDAARQVATPRKCVSDVMKELSDMEERLQSSVKRQRLAIQDSGLVDDVPPRRPLKPQAARKSRNVVRENLANGVRMATSVDEIEHAPSLDTDAIAAANDIEADADDREQEAEEELAERGAARPPPVNSNLLPLPWKGRIGYACLNTYLREAIPPVFSSRTCRIASIIQHRHPLTDPSQPEHPTKNRPDESKPQDIRLGREYVERLGLANAQDIVKMIRWNDKYGIKFMRLSSEMFPFASHAEYGYSLAPFASEALAEAGSVAGELGHRLTTHPGQFTQLGSPRPEVIKAAVRDLIYHDELLTLLHLPEQQDRDAVMILHMGGTYGDKAATLDRFRTNYATLSPSVKNRLVLENDDVSWTVHDLLPICEELNIPLVLDFHHHNIHFEATEVREGTEDIIELFPRIRATWTRKQITQKMHYSEQCPSAVTPRDRRKHSPRVRTLPPCADDMDLMIEAKDKEQAVFELMRAFRLPGYDTFNDLIPHMRDDDHRPVPKPVSKGKKKTPTKKRKIKGEDDDVDMDKEEDLETDMPETVRAPVSAEDFGMGGPQNRVYWPEGMEAWLKPKKREVKKVPKVTQVAA
ncbi:hypothetical protein VdG1_03935 [Verticillium dahliae VDG1]|nr:hypothetical protein VdG1_03935 [Verticillium dahliae VDG1]